MKLTVENVDTIFDLCLDNENGKEFEGVLNRVKLNMEKISEYKDEILDMLDELPENFRAEAGGGWSFLQMCDRKDGEQWTGLHQEMEKLVLLGMATGYVSFLMPKELWSVFPGGMPYLVINDLKTIRKQKLKKIERNENS